MKFSEAFFVGLLAAVPALAAVAADRARAVPAVARVNVEADNDPAVVAARGPVIIRPPVPKTNPGKKPPTPETSRPGNDRVPETPDEPSDAPGPSNPSTCVPLGESCDRSSICCGLLTEGGTAPIRCVPLSANYAECRRVNN